MGIIKTRPLQRPGLGIAGMTANPPSSPVCPFSRLPAFGGTKESHLKEILHPPLAGSE